MYKDVTELIERNRPKLIGKGLISGYPKLNGKRKFTSINNVINWRQLKINQSKMFKILLSKYTQAEILQKMLNK